MGGASRAACAGRRRPGGSSWARAAGSEVRGLGVRSARPRCAFQGSVTVIGSYLELDFKNTEPTLNRGFYVHYQKQVPSTFGGCHRGFGAPAKIRTVTAQGPWKRGISHVAL